MILVVNGMFFYKSGIFEIQAFYGFVKLYPEEFIKDILLSRDYLGYIILLGRVLF